MTIDERGVDTLRTDIFRRFKLPQIAVDRLRLDDMSGSSNHYHE